MHARHCGGENRYLLLVACDEAPLCDELLGALRRGGLTLEPLVPSFVESSLPTKAEYAAWVEGLATAGVRAFRVGEYKASRKVLMPLLREMRMPMRASL